MKESVEGNKNFLLLLIGQFVSVIGDRISSAVFITIAASIVNNIHTTYKSSLLLGVQFIPLFLFGYFFGTLADNFKKKFLMIIADSGRIVIMLILIMYHSSIPFLYLCVFLLGTFSAIFEPSRKAILPFLVKKSSLIFLNKVYAMMEILAMVIGLGVGAFLLQIISQSQALFVDMLTYVFSLTLILFIKYHDNKERTPIQEEVKKTEKKFMKFWPELKEGVKYLKKEANARYVITNLVFFHFLTAGLFFSTVTDFGIRTSREIGLKPGSSVSFVLFLIAIGALFSPLVKQFFGKMKESVLSQIVFFSGSAIFFISYLFLRRHHPHDIHLIFLMFFLIGIIAGLQYIRFLYLIHTNTDEAYMGRVVSIAEITISLTVVVGVVFGAYFNQMFTYRYGFLLVAIIYFIGALSFEFIKKKITW